MNRKACEAYFADQESDGQAAIAPYSRKWRQFIAAFSRFYEGVAGASFTPDEPWSLFELPDLAVVVAGLNSTMAESHRPGDHYGELGEGQLRWFASRLADYRDRGWLRIAAMHHHPSRAAAGAQESLRDLASLDRLLGQPGLVSLLLHGHGNGGRPRRLRSGLITLSAGSAAVTGRAGEPDQAGQVPNQYQLITLRPDRITRHARRYDAGTGGWTGDHRISRGGSAWHSEHAYRLSEADAALSARPAARPDDESSRERRLLRLASDSATPRPAASPGEDFLQRVAQATRVRFPEATVTVRRAGSYLRVTSPLPGGGAEQWPVGVADGQVTSEVLDTFLTVVHARFVSADPCVRSEFVYAAPPVPDALAARARRLNVRLRSFVEYQGLLDLRPLVERQNDRLLSDQMYPARMYVPQRFRVAGGLVAEHRDTEICHGLIEQAIDWLSADGPRFVMILGDFGRGKTAFLRQLARTIPAELPALLPVLVELRKLEKAPSLDELLAQHLVSQGVEDLGPAKLRYMISSGRLALLFDGFDELEAPGGLRQRRRLPEGAARLRDRPGQGRADQPDPAFPVGEPDPHPAGVSGSDASHQPGRGA